MDKHMEFARRYLLLIVLLMVPIAGAQAAKLYKWTDEEGNVHYTQIPPTERPSEVITPEQAPPAQPAAEEGDAEKPGEGVSAAQADNMRIKQENCEAARKNLAIYQSATTILQADGTELTLSDEMREAKIQETRKQIEFYCE